MMDILTKSRASSIILPTGDPHFSRLARTPSALSKKLNHWREAAAAKNTQAGGKCVPSAFKSSYVRTYRIKQSAGICPRTVIAFGDKNSGIRYFSIVPDKYFWWKISKVVFGDECLYFNKLLSSSGVISCRDFGSDYSPYFVFLFWLMILLCTK